MFSIIQAELSHARTIADFNIAMALETENKILPEKIILPGVKRVLKEPSKGFYLLALLDGKVVGQLMITFEWSDWRNSDIWWIQSVYVLPEFRKQGIYRALHNTVSEMASESRIKTIRLYVEKHNHDAQEVYKSMGMAHSIYDLYEVTLP